VVKAEDVVGICAVLASGGIRLWLTGGWGIDALLGEETRPHKDLDIVILLDDVVRLRELLMRDGFHLKELWPENAWVIDAQGVEVPTAFVLQDASGRELDVHAFRLDQQGDGIPAWANDEGLAFKMEDLAGEGLIAGRAVRCVSPGAQLLCHAGYELPAVQRGDLERLCGRFGLADPTEHSRRGPSDARQAGMPATDR